MLLTDVLCQQDMQYQHISESVSTVQNIQNNMWTTYLWDSVQDPVEILESFVNAAAYPAFIPPRFSCC